MKKILLIITALIFCFSYSKSFADGHGAEVYGPYPITLKGYEGDETNSVKYTGQMARQVLHDSLKKLVKTGDLEKMMAYYNGEDGLEIIAPKSKDGFQWKLDDIIFEKPDQSENGDQTMQAYPNVFEINKNIFMLYNGNEFGKTSRSMHASQIN